MKYLLPILCLLALTACTTNQVTVENRRSFTNPNWEGTKPYEVLVVGYAYSAKNRNQFETEVVAALKAKGIRARASYELWPLVMSVDAPTLQQYLASSEHTAVFLAHALAVVRDEHRAKQSEAHTLDSVMRRDHREWNSEIGIMIESALYTNDSAGVAWITKTKVHAVEQSAGYDKILSAFINGLLAEMESDRVLARLKD
ncbi:hypothetical protein [Coraliomargarita akajimensis]|uniref:Lipoprotein n=1 Tax=Coraliomargarita akajimensis (strain DSM 45221 / IAM 15411 / JCM 23193 / KCTC 12865 / 04OKA010-24) TaxID=583355 RepID=D5EPM6_CORAD|nr:hypothetical protein [Coraliomargarita akajimensis]ADE53763.1 hypothetical protein Caka_0739 [Coraliomargarita akajimensis DSM 45221]